MSFYSAEELREAEDTFHKQYGMTLAQWATIEQRMFYWFHYASDLPEDMARGVFYSSPTRGEAAPPGLPGSLMVSPPFAQTLRISIVGRYGTGFATRRSSQAVLAINRRMDFHQREQA